MKKLIALLVCVAGGIQAQPAPVADGSVRGKFYIAVNNRASIFVNGTSAFDAPTGESTSPELTLKPGDRVVARLSALGNVRGFMIAFVASDRRTIVNFPARAFRILSDSTGNDFTANDFAANKRVAVLLPAQGVKKLPISSQSEWIWGDAEVCDIGSLLTREMFRATLPGALGEVAKLDASAPVLTIEALVDGPSTLNIAKDRIFWMNGGNAKPGLGSEPTYINGETWTPKWGQPQAARGVDRSDNRAITLATLDLRGEVISNQEKRGVDALDRARTAVEIKRRGDVIVVTIPDPEPGARWYKIVFREKKR